MWRRVLARSAARGRRASRSAAYGAAGSPALRARATAAPTPPGRMLEAAAATSARFHSSSCSPPAGWLRRFAAVGGALAALSIASTASGAGTAAAAAAAGEPNRPAAANGPSTVVLRPGGGTLPSRGDADSNTRGAAGVMCTDYLIIGAGLAATTALRRIRALHPGARCTVLVERAASLRDADLRAFDGATLVVGRRIGRLDSGRRMVELVGTGAAAARHDDDDHGDDDGWGGEEEEEGEGEEPGNGIAARGGLRAIEYGACLLAQGGSHLPPPGVANFGPGGRPSAPRAAVVAAAGGGGGSGETGGGGGLDVPESLVVDCSRRPGAGAAARQRLVERVRSGELSHVTVVGGGWLGVELACELRAAAGGRSSISSSSNSSTHGGDGSSSGSRKRSACAVVLACAEAAPLARFLPKFMRGELRARLAKAGVQVMGYSRLAYVFSPAVSKSQQQERRRRRQRRQRRGRKHRAGGSADVVGDDGGDVLAALAALPGGQHRGARPRKRGLSPGDVVELRGLVESPAFNGRRGRVVGRGDPTPTGRRTVTVQLDDGGRSAGSSSSSSSSSVSVSSSSSNSSSSSSSSSSRSSAGGRNGASERTARTEDVFDLRPRNLVLIEPTRATRSAAPARPPVQQPTLQATFASAYDRQHAASVTTDALALAISHTQPAVETSALVHGACALEVDPRNGGVVCNAELSAGAGVFAAGDDVSYFDAALGRRRGRCADHDVATAEVAAANMVAHVTRCGAGVGVSGGGGAGTAAARPRAYRHTPVEAHHVAGTTFLAVGDCDASLDTHVFWVAPQRSSGVKDSGVKDSGVKDSEAWLTKPGPRGVCLYLRGNELAGAVAWLPRGDGSESGAAADTACAEGPPPTAGAQLLPRAADAFRVTILEARKRMHLLDLDIANDSSAAAASALTHRTFHDSSVLHDHLRASAAEFLARRRPAVAPGGSAGAAGVEVAATAGSLRLQSRLDSASKGERSLKQRHRASFRSPEDYLVALRANAAMHVSGGGGGAGQIGGGNSSGEWGVSLQETAARMELNPKWV